MQVELPYRTDLAVASVQVQGHRIAVQLRTPDWTAQVTEELRLGEDNTLPLSEHEAAPPPASPAVQTDAPETETGTQRGEGA